MNGPVRLDIEGSRTKRWRRRLDQRSARAADTDKYEGDRSDFNAEWLIWSNKYSVTATTTISRATIWVKIEANDEED